MKNLKMCLLLAGAFVLAACDNPLPAVSSEEASPSETSAPAYDETSETKTSADEGDASESEVTSEATSEATSEEGDGIMSLDDFFGAILEGNFTHTVPEYSVTRFANDAFAVEYDEYEGELYGYMAVEGKGTLQFYNEGNGFTPIAFVSALEEAYADYGPAFYLPYIDEDSFVESASAEHTYVITLDNDTAGIFMELAGYSSSKASYLSKVKLTLGEDSAVFTLTIDGQTTWTEDFMITDFGTTEIAGLDEFGESMKTWTKTAWDEFDQEWLDEIFGKGNDMLPFVEGAMSEYGMFEEDEEYGLTYTNCNPANDALNTLWTALGNDGWEEDAEILEAMGAGEESIAALAGSYMAKTSEGVAYVIIGSYYTNAEILAEIGAVYAAMYPNGYLSLTFNSMVMPQEGVESVNNLLAKVTLNGAALFPVLEDDENIDFLSMDLTNEENEAMNEEMAFYYAFFGVDPIDAYELYGAAQLTNKDGESMVEMYNTLKAALMANGLVEHTYSDYDYLADAEESGLSSEELISNEEGSSIEELSSVEELSSEENSSIEELGSEESSIVDISEDSSIVEEVETSSTLTDADEMIYVSLNLTGDNLSVLSISVVIYNQDYIDFWYGGY